MRTRSLKVLTRLHDQALQDGDDEMAMVTASSIATLLTPKDPQRAHEFLKLAQAGRAAAGQPWFGVRLRNIEAEIRYQLGDWAGALAQAQGALDQLDRLAGCRRNDAAGRQPARRARRGTHHRRQPRPPLSASTNRLAATVDSSPATTKAAGSAQLRRRNSTPSRS